MIRGGNITINGTANTTASGSGRGVHLFRESIATTIAATNNLASTGTVSGAGTGNGLRANGGNIGTAILMTAEGTATLKGIQTGNANNTDSALYLSGFRVNAAGDVTLQAEAASSNSLAIHMNRESGSLNNYDDGWRMQVRSSNGNVLIQSNQGAVVGADVNGGVNISGKNVTLDNTGGSFDTTTGAITLGSGTSTFTGTVGNSWTGTNWTPLGVSFGQASGVGNSTSNITATGNLTIGGSSSAAQGVVIGSAMTVAGNINLAGRSTSSVVGTNAMDINAGLTSTGGNVTLSADTMNIGAAVKAGSTGANTVTVKTVTAANKIDIGTGNSTSGADAPGTLGLGLFELNRISAGNLIIGDAANTGGILLSRSTTTTLATSGHLTLHTGGNIAINTLLTVGDATASKNLTLHGAGATSAITQKAAIKAAGLELLGTNATHTLNTAGNDIKKLAGNTHTVSLTNDQNFAIDTVNTLGLTTLGNTTLNSTAIVTQTQALSAAGLELLGTGGRYTLNHTNNRVEKLAGWTGSVALTSGGDLEVGTVNTVGLVTGSGGATGITLATLIGGNITVKNKIGSELVQLNAAGAVLNGAATLSDGIIEAKELRIKAGSHIGTGTDDRIQTKTGTLSLESAGDQFVIQNGNNASALTVASRTSNNGSIDIVTADATLVVGNATLIGGTAIAGITAHGSGNITLDGSSSAASGLVVNAVTAITADTGKITLTGHARGTAIGTTGGHGLAIGYAGRVASNGDIELMGTTDASYRSGDAFSGVYNAGSVRGRNVLLTAMANDATADVLGYYGAGSWGNSGLYATETLNVDAQSKGAGVGFYMWSGLLQSGTGMVVNGTSNQVSSGIGLDNGARLLNTTSGDVVMKGSTNGVKRDSLGLYKATIENASTTGGIQITALNNDILVNYGNAVTITNAGSGAVVLSAGPSSATDDGAINGTNLTINQNGSGGVQVKTSGTGNVITPKIVNAGTGAVVVAAGTAISKGTGAGGQVKTAAGNTISQTNATPGKTYIYTGNAAETSALSGLAVFGTDLYLSNLGANTKNAASNKAFADGPMTDGANAQVMFRERIALDGVALNAATITYGDSTGSVNLKDALQRANPSTGTGSGVFSQTTSGAADRFNISLADLAADSTSNANAASAVASNKSSSGNLKANTTSGYVLEVVGNDYNLTNLTAKLKVDQKVITTASIAGVNNAVYGTNVAAGAVSLGADVIIGDQVAAANTATVQNRVTNTSGNLNAGSYTQSVAGGLVSTNGTTDAANYTFAGTTTAAANYIVTP
ncbi:beta strand repeat-containing protein, partial [Limnohabitans sp.]|uniref:beta strand repeat-containing protein n=1 Tax=Limnohabitans sp. TaxID=1907725 RepID=UPI003918E613